MSITKPCLKVSDLPGYEQARLWWRARLPGEKTLLLDTQRYLFFPNIVLVLPVPLQGYMVVRLIRGDLIEERRVALSSKRIDKLRNLYKTANKKGWTIKAVRGGLEFIRPGRVVKVGAPKGERFLWS